MSSFINVKIDVDPLTFVKFLKIISLILTNLYFNLLKKGHIELINNIIKSII